MSAGCLILYKDGHGAKLQEKNVEITENGSTTVIPNSNFNGLSKVNITTNVSSLPLLYQDKTISILENTSTEVIPDSGYNALSKVTINTDIPTYVKANSLEELNALQNVKEGTLGLINGDDSCVLLVPFGLGIKTKKLYFNTTKNLKDIIYRGASEELYDFMNIASSEYSESDFDGSAYFQPNSLGIIDYVSQEGERMVGIWANTTQEKTYDIDSITRIYDINSGTWVVDNVEFSQNITFSDIYCMRFLETPHLYAEFTTDDFIHMNEWINAEVIGYSAIYQYIDNDWILVQGNLQSKQIDVIVNGEEAIRPDEGYGGLSEVILDVSIPEYIQSYSLSDLPITGINEGTVGLVYNNIVPFYPGISTNKLIFNTSNSYKDIYNNIINQSFDDGSSIVIVVLSTSGKTITDFYHNDNFYIPSKSMFLFSLGGKETLRFNNTDSEQELSDGAFNIIFEDNVWVYTSPIESQSYFSLDTFYVFKNQTISELLFTQTVDNFMNLKEVMTCQTNSNELIDTYKFINNNWLKQNKR